MSPSIERTSAERALLEGLEAGEGGQAAARKRLAGGYLPTRRVEDWKFTDLRAKLQSSFDAANRAAENVAPIDVFDTIDAYHIVIVNGFAREDLWRVDGLPAGVTIEALGDAQTVGTERFVFDLAEARREDGIHIRVNDGVALDRPLKLIVWNAGGAMAAHFRVDITLGVGAAAHVLETHAGAEGGYLSNITFNANLGDQAKFKRTIIQTEAQDATHLSGASYVLGRQAELDVFLATEGAALSRHEALFEFADEHAHAKFSAISLLAAAQHGDVTTFTDHAAPNCESVELSKSVLSDQARGVFQGKILVRPGAQKTDAQMGAHALLLSDSAEADAKPELEIYADDVKCAHGATTGDLDHEALFYMRARGLNEAQARALLVEAFLSELAEAHADGLLAEPLRARVSDWLETHHG